jgi:hypothetical protein
LKKEYIISSYDEKIIKNFLYYLVEDFPEEFLKKYNFSKLENYENKYGELTLIDVSTHISDNTPVQRYIYKLTMPEE